jgi:mono/diheme cytochrome c family protein
MSTLSRILIFAAALATGAQGQDLTGDATKGKEWFFNYNCYSCHGFSGQNGPGNRLVPMKMSQAAFTAYVRKPNRMPTYSSKVISDQQLADIWAHIKALPDAPAPKDIPLLQDIINSSK